MKQAILSPLKPRRIPLLMLLWILCCWIAPLLEGAQLADKDDLAEEVQKSEKLAIEKYPELGFANSAFNTTFLSAVKLLREKRPDFFLDSQWPRKLSDAVAVDLKVTPKVSLNSASIQESAENPRAYEELERYCSQSVKKALQKKEVTGTSKEWFVMEDQINAERIADVLTIAAIQSEETFDKILEIFLENMLSSSAPKASPKNEDWIEAALWRTASWRCIEKYPDAQQCDIICRLLAKCGSSKMVRDWILKYKHDIALRDLSILSQSQKAFNRVPAYALRAAVCERILSSNYQLAQLPIDKADFLNAATEMKMWKSFQCIPASEWGLLNGWELMGQLPSAPPSYNQAEWRKILDQLEKAIEARMIQVRTVPDANAPPPRDKFGCFEAYLVCGFSDFNGTQEGFEWVDSVHKKICLSPDPAVRGAAKFVSGFKVAALMWASKQK